MIFRRAVCSLCAICALLLLGACAALAPRDSGPRSAPFDMLGRVLVGYDGRAFSSNVRWQHGAEQDEVWMMTPTGQTLAHLREDSTGATITGTDQTKYHGSHVESLTKQALGWEFPLARLQHWVRGNPAPNVASEIAERDNAGRVTRMTQEGWRIGYEYTSAPEYDGLPRRVEVTNDAQNIRLVIDSWRRESQANGSSQGFSVTK
ncbi:MAG: lipoprotein insertase outer membrane protein LolB [Burkholderiales bacterium]